MSDETVTIHDARRGRAGLYLDLGDGKMRFVNTAGIGWTADQLEQSDGPTVPVRIVTTDSADPRVGRCGTESPAYIVGDDIGKVPSVCSLPAGHAGWHRDDMGAEWGPRIVTTDPGGEWDGPEAELRARVAYLEGRLADERAAHAATQAAHAKTRQNFAEHVGADFPAVGRCGASTPESVSQVNLACQLPAGHAGWHKSGTCEWGEPVELGAVRVGLDVDQEIRCRAADIAVRSVDRFTPFHELVVLAGRWEAWIRDGSVPEANEEK